MIHEWRDLVLSRFLRTNFLEDGMSVNDDKIVIDNGIDDIHNAE